MRGMTFVLGFGLPVSGVWATPDNLVAFARRAEDLGYGSLWTYQRLLAPAETDWGPPYRSVLDPVVALSFAAAVTQRVRLGVAVVNAPFLPPAMLARQFASLDVVSRGRLDAGLGLGWAPGEFAALGVPMERRGDRLEETVACLRALWAPDPVSFEGTFVTVPPSRFDPKPAPLPPDAGAAPAPADPAGGDGRGGPAPRRPDRGRLDQQQPLRRARAEVG